MQFQVPQFIEVEDKIFGPFTFKQFVYVAGAAGLSYMIFRALPLFFAAPLILGTMGFGAALAFLEYNGRPFILSLEHGFYYMLRNKLYLWDAERTVRKEEQEKKPVPSSVIDIPKLSESRLHELAWSLDIHDRIRTGEQAPEEAEALRE